MRRSQLVELLLLQLELLLLDLPRVGRVCVRERRLFVKERDERAHLGALPGIDVLGHDIAHLLVAERAQRRLLAALRDALPHRDPGPLQRAVDRRDARVDRIGDLLGRKAQHLAQD